jgi:hypothetical protein
MKAYRGMDAYTHIFLSSALAGVQWSATRPGRFAAGERATVAHWIGGWVGRITGLDDVEKILDRTRTRTPDSSVVKPVSSRYIDHAIPASLVILYVKWQSPSPTRLGT